MSPVSLLPIIPILLIALCVAYLAARLLKIVYKRHRYTAIDGLRGYLAMFVFLHHSAIWFFVIHYHQWNSPPSFVYAQFGPTSVALFFMITAFLFMSKLVDARGQVFDWLRLYISRVMRIMPLYLVVVTALFLTVGIVSHFVLREPMYGLLMEFIQWLFFIQTDINLMPDARLLIAAVAWSLAFEWLFYFSLGIVGAVFFRIKTSIITLIVTGLFFVLFTVILFENYQVDMWMRMSPFVSGILAAFLVRNEKIRKFGASRWLSPVLIFMVVYVMWFYPSLFNPIPFLCMTICFIAIACGNDLFGILALKASCLLGQISYGIYLLHALVLFITFSFLIGLSPMARISSQGYWVVIGGCAVVIVVICSFTYAFIEKPGVDKATEITGKVRRFFGAKKVLDL